MVRAAGPAEGVVTKTGVLCSYLGHQGALGLSSKTKREPWDYHMQWCHISDTQSHSVL